ncbi:hypothetical protein J27TS7_22200 [Paenibacillus dendritiformis]|nr:hypothetical protein J27TS7_22200 [Paenibacillus dendritiformis]
MLQRAFAGFCSCPSAAVLTGEIAAIAAARRSLGTALSPSLRPVHGT